MAAVAGFDLIFIDRVNERTLSAGVKFADGSDTMIGPVPFQGGLGPIRDALITLDTGQFGDIKNTDLMLTTVHFLNMHRGHNTAGQPYPLRLFPVNA